MKEAIALIKALTELIGTLIWPAVVIAAYFAFKPTLHEIVAGLPKAIGRMSKLKALGIEAELSAQSDAVAAIALEASAQVSDEQRDAAVKIASKAEQLPLGDIRKTVRSLADEYESLRRVLPPGRQRTTEMTRVVAKMRAFSLAAHPLLEEMKTSETPGERLMAVAVLQVAPAIQHLDWLVERFGKEQPFIFYQSAIAVQNLVAANPDDEDLLKISEAVASASSILKGFSQGEPDRNTLQILASIQAQIAEMQH